jgi:hypothetical protein
MTRTKRTRFPTRTIILSAMAGAVLEYLSDPDKGRRRRAVTRDQFWATVHHGLRLIGRQAHYVEGEAYGVVEETVHLHRPDNPNPDDATLRDRVESELFRDWTVPKGTIRGQVERAEDMTEIEEKVRHIAGVQTIHNYLHLPDTPAPNKARVLSMQ